MLSELLSQLNTPIPTVSHLGQMVFSFIFTLIAAPLLIQLTMRYPAYIQTLYRKEAESILEDPAPPPPASRPSRILIATTAVVFALLTAIVLPQATSIGKLITLLFVTFYVTFQYLMLLFHRNLVVDEMNGVALWVGLLAALFSFNQSAELAILGGATLYSIAWLISKLPSQILNQLTELYSPRLLSVFGVWLGVKTGLSALLVSLMLQAVLTLLLIAQAKLNRHNWLPPIIRVPHAGIFASFWYFCLLA